MIKKNILITGGAGFIGNHVVRLFTKRYPDSLIVNADALTYAGNLNSLRDVEEYPNYKFEKIDICQFEEVLNLLRKYKIDTIVHLAAESHVDRSIKDPFVFARTNVMGTLSLLHAAKTFWEADCGGYQNKLFYHVSTDEVYGSLGLKDAPFNENNRYEPHSPYSASKASSDHFVRAYHDTYGMPILISNCSNNYGPYQFPEKLIPLCIHNIKNNKPIPVYGKGENIRDWLYVEDHAQAIASIIEKGQNGQTYNIGGNNQWRNIDLIETIISITDRLLDRPQGASKRLISFVTDRAGHDLRYAIDASKITSEIGWTPQHTFDNALEKTIRWYLSNQEWLKNVTSGDYQRYYNDMYLNR